VPHQPLNPYTQNIQSSTVVAHLLYLFMAVVAWVVYKLIVSHYASILPLTVLLKYPYLSFYVLTAFVLVTFYLIDTALVRRNNRFVGKVSRSQFIRYSLLVIAVYGIMCLLTVTSLVDMEPSMRYIDAHFDSLPTESFLIESLALILLAPIVEELLYRHFLLGVIGFQTPYPLQIFMVVIVSILFSIQHHQYVNMTTNFQIFLLGVIFGYARMISGGLALPLYLHSLAIASGLLLNEFYISLGL